MSQLSLYSDSINTINPSDSISSFIPPTLPLTLPLTLLELIKRVRVNGEDYALWAKPISEDFKKWWSETQYGLIPARSEMRWDGKHISLIWQSL
jgi:hypothetical protein